MSASPWSEIRTALIEVFTTIAVDQITSPGGIHNPLETPAWNAEWQDRKVSFIHPGQGHALYLNITSAVARGWDERVYTTKDTGEAAGLPATGETDLYEGLSGLRRITLQAQSWCLEEDEDKSSFDIIQRIVTRMDSDRARQRLLLANVDYTDVGASRDMTKTIDKRRFSITAIDFTFTACVLEYDPVPIGYFERIILTSHEQVGSEDVSASLRMIEEELPPSS